MPRLVVVGSSNTDMTVRLPRLPSPGQTLLGGSLLTGPGGKGANQAVAAARAGGEVVFLTAVGDDAFGKTSLEGYAREGIDVSHARVINGVASGVALIFVGDDGENMIGVAPGANASLGAEHVELLPGDLFTGVDLVLIAGLEVPLEFISRALLASSRFPLPILLNPAPVHPDLLTGDILERVNLLTPNRVELSQLTGIDTQTEESVRSACRSLKDKFPSLDIVATLGSEGTFVHSDAFSGRIPAFSVKAVDTVGAGDAFNGALAVALGEGRPLAIAAEWASAVAALAVTRPGAQAGLPSRTEIDRFVADSGRLR